MALSKPWAEVGLTLVVKNSSNVTSLREALDKWMTFYVVTGSADTKELQKLSSYDVTTLQQRAKSKGSVNEGLMAVAMEEKSALVLNSVEARYYITHDFCHNHLVAVQNFQALGSYAFAFPPGSLELEAFNKVIVEMKKDGSLEKLKEKKLGIPGKCSDATFLYPGTTVTFLLATVVSRFRV